MKGARIKFAVFIAAVALGIWSLMPTYQLYFVLPGQENALKARLARAATGDDSARVQVELANFQQR